MDASPHPSMDASRDTSLKVTQGKPTIVSTEPRPGVARAPPGTPVAVGLASLAALGGAARAPELAVASALAAAASAEIRRDRARSAEIRRSSASMTSAVRSARAARSRRGDAVLPGIGAGAGLEVDAEPSRDMDAEAAAVHEPDRTSDDDGDGDTGTATPPVVARNATAPGGETVPVPESAPCRSPPAPPSEIRLASSATVLKANAPTVAPVECSRSAGESSTCTSRSPAPQ
mmetsp:Transcript_26081/g.84202  ORF Transcript_26081/g.84202 Transcript_26081/m.84202 type:complete len:232 (-) Transcript_26081:460-1155(-)